MTQDREANQIFHEEQRAQEQLVEQRVESVKAEFGMEQPSETVPLPSKGLVYPENSSLHNKELIEIRPMTTREEDILTSQALLKKGTVVTELIKACLIDKTVSPADMVVGDRNALMIAIRISGYGAEYDADVECEQCELKSTYPFDLGALEINRLLIDPVKSGTNEFAFSLPIAKKPVTFRFLTGRDEQEILLVQERQRKQGMVTSNLVTTNLQYTIVSVDGVRDRSSVNRFIMNMRAGDSLALRNFMREKEPGMNMKQNITCPGCGYQEEVSIPLGVNFLWPSAK